MFKKLLYIFLAGMILVALLGTNAAAGCVINHGKLICSDLTTSFDVSGLGNLSKIDAFACSSINIGYAYAERLCNNGGNSIEANSGNFDPIPLTSGTQQVTVEQLSEDERGTYTVTYSWSWENVIWPTVAYALGAPQDNNWRPCEGTPYCIDDITVALVAWTVNDKGKVTIDEECVHCESDCQELGPENCDGVGDCAGQNGGCGITCNPTAASDCYPPTLEVDLFGLCESEM
jgi:hypothetical protein